MSGPLFLMYLVWGPFMWFRNGNQPAKQGRTDPGVSKSEMVTSIQPLHHPSRIRSLVFPREHGAWGLLLVPLVTGACVAFPYGNAIGNLVLFLLTSLSLFCLRTPLESWLGFSPMRAHTRDERNAVLQTLSILAPFSLLCLLGLFWGGRNRGLLLIGSIAGASFALQACVRLFGRKLRTLAQIIGCIGLTSTSAGAYYVVTGRLDRTALALWIASWLFAGNQVHYVQSRIRNVRAAGFSERAYSARIFIFGQILMLVAVVAAERVGLLPLLAIIAFLPVTFRGFFWLAGKARTLDVQRLGLAELLHGITFGVLLMAAFILHH